MPKRDRKGKGDAMKRLRAMALAALGVVTFGSVVMAGKKGGTRSVASAKDGTAASSQDAAAVSTNGTGNLSKQRREELVKKIAEIRRFLAKSSDTNAVRLVAFADELAKEVKAKKYGLVFEEHKEKIDIQLEHSLPMLTEDRDRFIDNGGELNFLIEGDNLAALKLLEKTHRGKINLIYIDPPYNTGNKDFIYNDQYVDANDTFRHSKWLSFMKRRLAIAKALMADVSTIFISIDDNEYATLKVLCDDMFGAENVETMIWHKVDNDSGKLKITHRFRCEHEYILVVYKNKVKSRFKKFLQKRNYKNKYTNPDNDPRGEYKQGIISDTEEKSSKNSEKYYSVTTPSGKVYTRRWRMTKDEFDELDADNRIYYGKKGDAVPSLKVFINEEGLATPVSILEGLGTAKTAGAALTELFDGEKVFSYPKPVELIAHLVMIASNEEDRILDFFAGSGTTGQSVLSVNAKDGGKRKFILVTNNENGICEKVTYERLKRVIEKEKYAARLKYMKIDYLPIEERMYDRYAEDLLKHVRELVELENGLDFEHETGVAIVLTDAEAETLAKDKKRLAACRVIYKGHNVLLGAKTAAALEKSGVTIRPIPKYYYPELEY